MSFWDFEIDLFVSTYFLRFGVFSDIIETLTLRHLTFRQHLFRHISYDLTTFISTYFLRFDNIHFDTWHYDTFLTFRHITLGLNKRRPNERTIMAAFDLSKAFDIVHHLTLIQDLMTSNQPIHINSYLEGRQTYVEFRNSFCKYRKAKQLTAPTLLRDAHETHLLPSIDLNGAES